MSNIYLMYFLRACKHGIRFCASSSASYELNEIYACLHLLHVHVFLQLQYSVPCLIVVPYAAFATKCLFNPNGKHEVAARMNWSVIMSDSL